MKEKVLKGVEKMDEKGFSGLGIGFGSNVNIMGEGKARLED